MDKFATERAESVREELVLDDGYKDTMASAYAAGLKVSAQAGINDSMIRSAIDNIVSSSSLTQTTSTAPGQSVNTTTHTNSTQDAHQNRTGLQGTLEGSGEIRGSHSSDSGVNDKIADAIMRSVKADTSNSVELAKRLATDATTKHENMFTHGLSDSDQSQLERSATDVVTSTKAFEQAEATRSQYGMSASYRADHLSQAMVRNPANWAATKQEFMARFGYLNGDLGRVSDKYKHLLGREQSEAFGMVSLLLGHDRPTIAKMSETEKQSAREFGYRLVSETMGGAQVGGVNPNAYQGLVGTAPAFGQTRNAVRAGGLHDPREEASYVRGNAEGHYNAAKHLVGGTHDEVSQRYGTDRANQAIDQARQRAHFNEGRREALGQQIQEQGVLPQSLPAWTVEKIGGVLTGMKGQAGALNAGTDELVGKFLGALGDGLGLQAAMSAAGAGWTQARQDIMDVRLAGIRGTGERQLTDAQMGVYRAAMESYMPYFEGVQNALGTDLAAARQRLVAEEGHLGEAMANILVSAAWSQQDAGLAPLRAYNQAETSQEKLRAQIEDLEKKSAEPRGGRVGGGPIEAPAHLQGHLQSLEVRYGLPTGLLTAIAYTESGFDPNAVSHAGAQGMFQLMPGTASRLGVADPFDPEQGAVGAAKHLAASYAHFGNWEHAIMAYNAGDGRMEKFLAGEGKPLKQETIDYLPKVATALQRVRVG